MSLDVIFNAIQQGNQTPTPKREMLQDIGEIETPPAVEMSDEPKKYYPTLYLDSDQINLPGAKLNDEIYLMIKVVVKGVRLEEFDKDPKECYDLEVQKAGIMSRPMSEMMPHPMGMNMSM